MSNIVQLSLKERRVIGVLLEKELTTPEQYPLSLNALTNACNQKSNRDPVLALSESEVQQTIDELTERGMIIKGSGFGSRVSKYKHRFCNTEFSKLQLDPEELAIICVLLLRGAQTPGELRSRTQRLYDFSHVDEVDKTLEKLVSREDGPFVNKLPREPGKRESRYEDLFCDEEATASMAIHSHVQILDPRPESPAAPDERLDLMELQIEDLQEQLDELNKKLNLLLAQKAEE